MTDIYSISLYLTLPQEFPQFNGDLSLANSLTFFATRRHAPMFNITNPLTQRAKTLSFAQKMLISFNIKLHLTLHEL